MKVVKLGGSLLNSGYIVPCLTQIIKTEENVVVVCGGGEFANQVRTAQIKWKFDEIAAHEMAILAMKQTAIICQKLQPEFTIVSSILDITQHRFTIWSPNIVELNADQIEPSWKVTSDSLAAWLATKLKAKELIIVKSQELPPSYSVHELVRLKVLDDAFTEFVKNTIFELKILSAQKFLKT